MRVERPGQHGVSWGGWDYQLWGEERKVLDNSTKGKGYLFVLKTGHTSAKERRKKNLRGGERREHFAKKG